MTISSPSPGSDARPAAAIIAVAQTPYRLHAHRRIVREIPQVKLWSVFTHDIGDNSFPFDLPEEIGPMVFARGESSAEQQGLRWQPWEWRKAGRVISWIKKEKIRAVMMQGYNDAGRFRIINWCHRHGIPCFLFGDSNIHGDLAHGAKAVVKRLLLTRLLKKCTGVMVCGRLGREYFAKYGVPRDRMYDYPYEPDYALIDNLPAAKIDEAAQKFGLKKGRRRIVFSGRMVPQKRPELLVDAFIAIADQRPEWDLVMLGDGALKESLRAKLPERLASRVTWTGFVNDQELVTGVYKQSDILVLPSDYEPWALVVNEAAQAGLAIVATSVVGAAAELVRDGVNGRLFPPGDLDALIECLLQVSAADKIDGMRHASPIVVNDWRRRGDPINGWRQALRSLV